MEDFWKGVSIEWFNEANGLNKDGDNSADLTIRDDSSSTRKGVKMAESAGVWIFRCINVKSPGFHSIFDHRRINSQGDIELRMRVRIVN